MNRSSFVLQTINLTDERATAYPVLVGRPQHLLAVINQECEITSPSAGL